MSTPDERGSPNLHRRHLDSSQRAWIGSLIKPHFEAEARERQLASQNNDAGQSVRANLPELDQGRARDKAAEAVNVSPRLIESASPVRMAVCKSNGHNVSDHFTEVSNMVDIGSGAMRSRVDYRLSRLACYLVAMGGDGSKPEVAAARLYFASSTNNWELGGLAQVNQAGLNLEAFKLILDPITNALQAQIAMIQLEQQRQAAAITSAHTAGQSGGTVLIPPPNYYRIAQWSHRRKLPRPPEGWRGESDLCVRISNSKRSRHPYYYWLNRNEGISGVRIFHRENLERWTKEYCKRLNIGYTKPLDGMDD